MQSVLYQESCRVCYALYINAAYLVYCENSVSCF